MSRPNIILIITDQQRYETIVALGFPHVNTPNLDRLVNEGVAFSQCNVTAPILRTLPSQFVYRLFSPQFGRFEKQ